jgi:hypothetical protein
MRIFLFGTEVEVSEILWAQHKLNTGETGVSKKCSWRVCLVERWQNYDCECDLFVTSMK